MEVALLTEGVDRNDYGGTPGFWRLNVALLAEGVDRNIVAIDQFDFLECRPPRGEHTSNPLSIRLHSLSFFAGRSSVRRATAFFHANQRRDRVLRARRWSFFVSALFYRHPPCRRRKMPPAGVSTLAISFSCTTADRYPLWQ